jgi:acetate kinase
VLTINGGSSSIKFALFAPGEPPRRRLAGSLERIGLADPVLTVNEFDGRPPVSCAVAAPDHEHAAGQLIQWLSERVGFTTVGAVGHRVVHGGPRYRDPQPITPNLLEELGRLRPLDPAHLPGEIALIEAFRRHHPNLPQVACFDTAFHRDLPRVARLLPIPRRFEAAGVERYGFHGISYSFLMEELARVAGADAARKRIILAHLGAGASLAAVGDGHCIDTTMAFTPTAGLVMGTRSGDLDPGLLVYLLREEKMSAEQIDDLVNRRAGLLGVSEVSSDMRDLLGRQGSDPRAAEAVALFCYQAKKWIGAFAAALGGVDTLVFSAGIGENAAEVRARICEGLDFLGLALDPARNAAGAPLISATSSRVSVRVIRTDEELMIAKTVCRLLGSQAAQPER